MTTARLPVVKVWSMVTAWPLLQGFQGGGVGDGAPVDQLGHGDAQNVLGGEAGDHLVRVIAPDGAGLGVSDKDAIERALQNGHKVREGGGVVWGKGDGGGVGEIDTVSVHGLTSG